MFWHFRSFPKLPKQVLNGVLVIPYTFLIVMGFVIYVFWKYQWIVLVAAVPPTAKMALFNVDNVIGANSVSTTIRWHNHPM